MIAGTVTSVCCESTARDAAALGYEVIFLGDVRGVDELFDFAADS